MRLGLVIYGFFALLGLAVLVFLGAWHGITLHMSRHPMLSWLPIVVAILLGFAAGALTRKRFHFKTALLVAGALLFVGAMETLFFKSNGLLNDFEHGVVASLPDSTQPRLLPRSGVRDDPQFANSKEIHLARDPASGALMWTGEWDPATFGGPSQGVAVKRLDDVVSDSIVVRSGFEHSVSGIGPGTIKWKSKLKHPFSRIQYPVIVPAAGGQAVAIMPYMGYKGFPFRRPYLKGVMLYHEDGTLEDLSPEEAAARPELVRTGRIVPEILARKQAEALAHSDDLDGEIVDGEGNRQPFLTALDRDRTVWLTIINQQGRAGNVKALVLANSSTGETQVWKPPPGAPLISTRQVVNEARSMPLRWEERRCCDSDGHSYTVTLREVVEPRLAFKDAKPYYMVTVVPTSELALARQVEFTLLIDARTGARLDTFKHVEGGPEEDARLQAFFTS